MTALSLAIATLVGLALPASAAPGFSVTPAPGDGLVLLAGRPTPGAEVATEFLRVYRARPTFEAAGGFEVVDSLVLSDPDRHIPFTITNQFSLDRRLTWADLTIRSVQRAPDGTLWFGDAQGPYLVHTDATGKLLGPPVAVPDPDQPGLEIHSPDNPHFEESASLRLMNALRAHAVAHGATRMPIFAPYSLVLDDHDPATVSPLRMLPGSPSSEVHDVARLQAAGHAVVAWTVNDTPAMNALLKLGVRGLISDRPDLLRQAVAAFDANGDGRPGDYLDADGLIDRAKFDAQGHRGARNLRPESSLPAFEAALDHLMTTLETDCAITADGVPILHHDPEISAVLVRELDRFSAHGAIHHKRLKDLVAHHDLGRLLPFLPTQQKDAMLSPVSGAFARQEGLSGPYAWPTLRQALRFVKFYEQYYRFGPGGNHPEAARRWKNAARVHFDVETKVSPFLERAGATMGARDFVHAVAGVIHDEGLEDRTMIQSFDMRTLLAVHEDFPRIQTMLLLGEAPPFGTRTAGQARPHAPGRGDLWAADALWPHRHTHRETPWRSPSAGGLGALALSPDGLTLYPMLQQPLTGSNEVPIFAFDLSTQRFGPSVGRYPLESAGASVPEFILTGPNKGLALERGAAPGHGKLFRVTLGAPGSVTRKDLVADLEPLLASQTAGAAGLQRVLALPVGTTTGLRQLGPRRIGLMAPQGAVTQPGRSFILLELENALSPAPLPAATTPGP